VAEVIATTALKASNESTKLYPSLVAVCGYGIAFYFMTLTLKSISLGISYAIWPGVGIVLIAVSGAVVYKQISDLAALLGMSLIITGVIIIHVFSKTLDY